MGNDISVDNNVRGSSEIDNTVVVSSLLVSDYSE